MTIVGEQWNSMSDDEQAPFIELAKEESKEYEKERALMEKAQRPNEMWQPIRRCLMVVETLAKDEFADIFLEPVDLEDFPDYEELIDQPMDLGTIKQKLKNRKYQAPEQFARDMRKVRPSKTLILIHFAGSLMYYFFTFVGLEQLQDLQSPRISNLACRRFHVEAV